MPFGSEVILYAGLLLVIAAVEQYSDRFVLPYHRFRVLAVLSGGVVLYAREAACGGSARCLFSRVKAGVRLWSRPRGLVHG
jgi:hypothetical protein